MHNDWDPLFDQEIQKDYLLNLRYFLAKEYKTKNIYPAKENIFAAFKTTSLKDTKVVILGQDPVFRGLHHECLEAILRKS